MKFILTSLLLAVSISASIAAPNIPLLAAKSAALYDHTSGQFLFVQNADERVEPGSLTKLMTAYVTFGALQQNKLSLSQKITPSAYAVRAVGEEPRMFLEAGKPVKVEELLRGLIVQSGNDAARTLAEAIAHHEVAFAADLMNAEAKRLGMSNTHFANATGIAEELHYSTAHDLALLAAALIHDYPQYYSLYSIREYIYNTFRQFNHNQLLWLDPYVDGLQTGWTEDTGFSLAASANRDGRRLISILLGADTESLRNSESQRLLNYGYQDFEAIRLYDKDQPVSQTKVWKGTERKISIGSHESIYVSIPKGQREQLKATQETWQPVVAPVNNGQRIGTLKISLAGKPYVEIPLVALESIPLANVFSRGVDTLRLFFE